MGVLVPQDVDPEDPDAQRSHLTTDKQAEGAEPLHGLALEVEVESIGGLEARLGLLLQRQVKAYLQEHLPATRRTRVAGQHQQRQHKGKAGRGLCHRNMITESEIGVGRGTARATKGKKVQEYTGLGLYRSAP